VCGSLSDHENESLRTAAGEAFGFLAASSSDNAELVESMVEEADDWKDRQTKLISIGAFITANPNQEKEMV